MNNNRINFNLDKFNELKNQIAELQAEQKFYADQIKTFMDKQGLDYLKTDKYQVFFEEQIQHRFNEKQFIKEFGQEVYDKFKTKEVSSKPFKPMLLKQP